METQEYKTLYKSEDRHWWYLGLKDLVLSSIGKYADRGKATRILDAGCGTGGILKHLNDYKAYGLDISQEAIKFCRLRKLENVINASISNIPFKDNSFNIIISLDVLYHLGVKDDLKALKELARLLSRGGTLLLNLPAYDSLRGKHDKAVHTRGRYTLGELREKVKACGLIVEKISYRNTVLFPLAFLKRSLEGRSAKGQGRVDSDLALPPSFINKIFTEILFFENRLLRMTNFPFGLSIFCVARKK